MTTYTTRPHDPQDPVFDDAAPQERSRTSPVLLGALAVALVALGVWWSSQRDVDITASTSTPAVTEPMPSPLGTPAVQDARRDIHAATAKRTERTRPVIADHAPRPLPGNPMPEYPPGTLRSGAEGSVTLSIQVDATGAPVDVQVVQRSGDRDRDFDRAAVQAVSKWRFEPAVRNGKAVSSTVQLPVEFRRG